MKLVPRGGMWQVHFTDSSNARQRLSTKVKVDNRLPDKGKALATLAGTEVMREHLLGTVTLTEARKQAGNSVNLAYALQKSMADRWSDQKSARERRYLVNALVRDIGYWPLKSVDYNRLREYAKELEAAGDKPATRNRKMSTIHAAMADAKLRGELDALPDFPHFRENNIKERYLTPVEEATLLKSMQDHAAPGDVDAQYMLAMVPFLLDTGLRAGETLLAPEQDLGHSVWLPHGSTKSGKGRTVPLTERARECLDRILASPVHAMLRDRMGHRTMTSTFKASHWMGLRFRTACDRAKLKGVTLHTLRHTCASRLVQAGVSLYMVRDWLGHSTITTTERYAHLAPSSMDVALAALETRTAVVQSLEATINAGNEPPVLHDTDSGAKLH